MNNEYEIEFNAIELDLIDLGVEGIDGEMAWATLGSFSTTSSVSCAGSCAGTVGTGSSLSSAG